MGFDVATGRGNGAERSSQSWQRRRGFVFAVLVLGLGAVAVLALFGRSSTAGVFENQKFLL